MYLDMTTQRVTQLANSGILSRQTDGTYLQEAARVAYIRYLRRQAQTRAGTGDKTASLIETKTLKAQLDLAIARGEFVSTDAVEEVLSEAFASLRNEFAGIGASVTRDLSFRAQIDHKINDGIARVRSTLETFAANAFRDSRCDEVNEESGHNG